MPAVERFAGFEDRWHDAVSVVQHRRLMDTPGKRQMMEAAERYNNAIVFPLEDVDGEPDFPAIAASIIADSIDGFATKANDTTPVITAPAVDPKVELHRNRADSRRHAWGATYHYSKLPLVMGRSYRQLFGYATFCMFAEPVHRDQYGREVNRPRIATRDPMLAYPEPMGNDEIRAPADIGFIYGRSPQWIRKTYPEAAAFIDDYTSADNDLWDVLDWTDGQWCMVGVIGRRSSQSGGRRWDSSGMYSTIGDAPMDETLLVRAYPNRAGMVPAVCPQQVTLDRLVSAISRIVPTTDLMNKLAALNFISAEKGVFPHIVVVGENGQTPEVEGGTFKDGRSGEANLLSNTKAVTTLTQQPSPAAQTLLSDLERSARLSTGNPSVFQGEFQGSVRSGQTISQLAGYSVDPRLTEAHHTMGYALGVMNEATAAIFEGYWPRRKYTVFSGWAGANRHVSFVPEKIWGETKESVVSYPMPGMDAQNATIAIASLNQARMLSRRTGMKKHPLVDDEVGEERYMIEESLDDAIVMVAVELVRSGQLAWTDLAIVREKVRSGLTIEVAIAEAQEEAQERQATEAPAPEQGMVAPPEAMPGLNAPGAGGEMAMPQAGAPPGTPVEQFDQVAAALMSQPGAMAQPGATSAA